MHLIDFRLAILNVANVFFGYPKYSSVTKMLFGLGLPSFSTLIHHSKVSFASRLSVIMILHGVFSECVLSLSLCLSVCVLSSVYVCVMCMSMDLSCLK